MSEYRRYAIYYAPPAGPFADRVAAWLGWNPATGREVAQPVVGGLPRPLAEMTEAPRKYGFHGTIKAPFRLAEGLDQAMVQERLDRLGARLSPVGMPGLALVRLGSFLALAPGGDETDLMNLAAEVVTDIDDLRAPLTPAEMARRRPERLSSRQRELLALWGYPYVLEEFRFHLTLSDSLPDGEAAALADVAGRHLADVLPRPFVIADLCLFGEAADGRFHLVSRHALTG
jgi:putative phosphonate metabolism protein